MPKNYIRYYLVIVLYICSADMLAQTTANRKFSPYVGIYSSWKGVWLSDEGYRNFWSVGPALFVTRKNQCGPPLSSTALSYEHNFGHGYKSIKFSQKLRILSEKFLINREADWYSRTALGFDINTYFKKWGELSYTITPTIYLFGFIQYGYSIPLSKSNVIKPTHQFGIVLHFFTL